MKTCIKPLLAISVALLNLSATAGPWLDRYWPLNEGDQKTFTYGSGNQVILNVYDMGGGSFEMTEDVGGTSQELFLQEDADTSYLTGSRVGWTGVSMDPYVTLFTEILLQNGGTVTTTTTASQPGISYPATFTVKVAKAGTVKVPAGTYDDCRSITSSETAQVPGYGTVHASALTAYLAPGVGIIKMLVTSGQWAVLMGGTVAGVPVGHGSSQLAVLRSGNGTVTPDYNSQVLECGRIFTMTAKPGNGYVFSNWVDGAGTVLTNAATLTFTMQSNLVLQANFVPNPFIPTAGTYAGLFYDPSGVTSTNAGFFTAKVASSGLFTAKLQQGANSWPLSGQFSADGTWATASIKGAPGCGVSLRLDLAGGDQLLGVISNAFWRAELAADRAVYSNVHPALPAGKYTMVIPGSADCANLPGGYGAGAVSVSAAGAVAFKGSLGDGTPATQSAAVSKTGQWPLYVPLYAKRGLLIGWLNFTNDLATTNDLKGVVNWIKPGQAGAKLYPGGFEFCQTNGLQVSGSCWSNCAPLLNWSNGVVVVEKGALSQELANNVTVAANGKVKDEALTNKLSLTITVSSGLFKGSVKDAATGKSVSFSGALLQKQNLGCGCILGTNQSGRVLLLPE